MDVNEEQNKEDEIPSTEWWKLKEEAANFYEKHEMKLRVISFVAAVFVIAMLCYLCFVAGAAKICQEFGEDYRLDTSTYKCKILDNTPRLRNVVAPKGDLNLSFSHKVNFTK